MKFSKIACSAFAFFPSAQGFGRIQSPHNAIHYIDNYEYPMLTGIIESEVDYLAAPDEGQQQHFIEFLETLSFYEQLENVPDFWKSGFNLNAEITKVSQMNDIPIFKIPNGILKALSLDTDLFKLQNEVVIREAFAGQNFDIYNIIDMLNIEFMILTTNNVQSFDISKMDTALPLMYRRAYPDEYALISTEKSPSFTNRVSDASAAHQIPIFNLKDKADCYQYRNLKKITPFSIKENTAATFKMLKKNNLLINKDVLDILKDQHESNRISSSALLDNRMIQIKTKKILRLDKIPVLSYGNHILGGWLNQLNTAPIHSRTKRMLTVVTKIGGTLKDIQAFDEDIQMLCKKQTSQAKGRILDVNIYSGFPHMHHQHSEKKVSIIVDRQKETISDQENETATLTH